MYKQKRTILFLLYLFLLYTNIEAQIVITPSAGCLPVGLLNANFVFSGGNASNIVWNFGDGSANSNVNPSQHSYLLAGVYVVSFSATVNGLPVSYTATASVFQPPNGSFTYQIPSTHCVPMSVPFVGISTGPGMNFTWDFGDNSLGSGSNPTHAYTTAGSFTPILTVQDPGTGCFKNITGGPIVVSNPPSIQMNISPGNFTCATTFSPVFTASNSLSGSPLPGGALTYSWTFGNGQLSASPSPGTIAYSGQGTFTVNLTVKDNNQCSSSTSSIISLVSPTLNAIVPTTVCVKGQYTTQPQQVFSVSIQSSEPFTVWNMGDGTILSFPPSPTVLTSPTQVYFDSIYSFSTPGLHTISITATKGSCVAAQTKTLWVEKITPEFTHTAPTWTCNPNFPAFYLNQSTVNTSSSLSYTWYAQQWPTNVQALYTTNLNFIYTQNSANPSMLYNTYTPNVKLIAQSSIGCWAEQAHIFDTISRPTAFFKVDKSEGCAPLTVTFRDTSYYFKGVVPPTYTNSITNYTWYSGGSGPGSIISGTLLPGSTTNSAIPSFTFTYATPGVYSPSLAIQTTFGCGSISYVGTITVVNPPAINYSLTSTTICAGQPFQFTLSSVPSGTVQHWHVDTDEGYYSGCVSDSTPAFKFTHLGPHTFTISAYKNSCLSTLPGTQTITVLGPLIRAWYKVTCFSNSVDFFCDMEDITSATINFGDGSIPNPAPIPGSGTFSANLTHLYPGPGDYTVTVKAYNNMNGCNLPYTQTLSVHVRNLKAGAIIPPIMCKGLLPLDASLSSDHIKGGGKTYNWLFDYWPPMQTTKSSTTASQNYSVLGVYSTTLVVKDINGCVDQVVKTFRVSEPSPSFTFNSNPVCVSNLPVQMINTTPQFPDAVNNFLWSFGDGNPSTTFTATALTPVTFSYNIGAAQSKTFQVILQATSVIGCFGYSKNILTVNDPKLNVTASTPGMCLPGGQMVFNINSANTHSLYQINWGDQNTTSSTSWASNATFTTAHAYTSTGIYTPTINLTDNGGCTNSVVLGPIYVQSSVVPTFTFFNIKSPNTTGNLFCMPVTLSVTSTSDSLQFPLTYYWHSGKPNANWNMSSSFASGATYTTSGIYNYSLMLVTKPSGCTSVFSSSVQIDDPHIDFVIEPDDKRTSYCLGDPIIMRVTNTKGTAFWDWDFGDGNLRGPFMYPTFQSVLVYENTYFPVATNGMLTFQVVGKVNGNPQCKDFKRRTLNIVRAFPDFKRNEDLQIIDYKHCLGRTETFTNLSSTNGGPLTYTWSLGNGATSTFTDVVYQYPSPGTFWVKLFALESANSCTAETVKPMVIYPLPTAKISISDTLSCPDTPFSITVSGVPGIGGPLKGLLIPSPTSSLNLAPTNSAVLTASAFATTNYTFSVIDTNACVSKPVEAKIGVQKPAPSIHTATTVIIGQQVQLNAGAGPGYNYTWTPQTKDLSDSLIYNPVSSSTVDISYSVTIVDEPLHCFITVNTYSIFILPLTTVDVPTAFTPNGDGINDIIYVGGWGIRKLIFFKIYDRWGQLLFESNDLKHGWDGTFEGVPQNIETYVYQVEVETYVDSNPKLDKSGTFKLIR